MPLSPNLLARQRFILAVHPTLTIFGIGDTAHMSEHSDHDPDARGIWHAIDIMTRTDASYDGAAAIMLAWLLSDVTDLQYVIHDDRIYGVNEKNGWKGTPYDPTNPNRDKHLDHIHVSSLHGPTGYSAQTGTGYSTAAERYVPAVSLAQFMEENDMPTADEIAKAIMEYPLANKSNLATLLVQLGARTDTEVNHQNVTAAAALAGISTKLDTIAANTKPAQP